MFYNKVSYLCTNRDVVHCLMKFRNTEFDKFVWQLAKIKHYVSPELLFVVFINCFLNTVEFVYYLNDIIWQPSHEPNKIRHLIILAVFKSINNTKQSEQPEKEHKNKIFKLLKNGGSRK